jgi:hypothetical protein
MERHVAARCKDKRKERRESKTRTEIIFNAQDCAQLNHEIE